MADFSFRKTDINKYIKGSKNKSYFVASITILFLIVFIILGVIPAYDAVLNQMKQNSLRDEAIEKLNNKVETLKSLDNQNKSKAETLEYFSKVFPLGNIQDNVIEKIFTLASKNSVTINSAGFTDETGRKPINQYFKVSNQINYISLSISLKGSATNLINFVKDLEDSRIIFNVLNVDLTKNSEEESTSLHNLRVVVQYFYYEPDNL